MPHPHALFSLVPLNNGAEAVLKHPENKHLVSVIDDTDNGTVTSGLDIGPFIGTKSRYTLATIGRSGDIKVEGRSFSRIHCSFELNESNGTEVMLQDRSSNGSTKLFGGTSVGFESERAHRRVVVDDSINLVFGFGGQACDLVRFRLVWHAYDKRAIDLCVNHREDNPRQTRTMPDEPPTVAPSRAITRIHTPGPSAKIRYSKRKRLGQGAFGEVWRVANVDTGNYLAMKRVKRPALQTYEFNSLRREVETLSRVSHKNIIQYIAAQWGEDDHLDIFMELKPGNALDLIQQKLFINQQSSAVPFLHQMLQALDYLANQDIVHRDVKPENILYSSPAADGGYLYQLADFGLANTVADARTFAGSRMYMAPELEQNPQSVQTTKMDIWSLFVTLAYAMNAAGFQEKQLYTVPQRLKAIQEAADEAVLRPLRGMAAQDPGQRATAGDILDKVFAGDGRTTPRNEKPQAYTAAASAEIGASEQRAEQGDAATDEGRSRQTKPTPRTSGKAVAAAAVDGGRPTRPFREAEKQLSGATVKTPVPRAPGVGARVRKRTRQDKQRAQTA